MSNESNTLVEGIINEAQKRADTIIAEAKAESDRILAEAREEAEKKKKAERRATELTLSTIRLKEESAKRSVDRLYELKRMDMSYSLVMGKVNAAFSSMAGSGELRQALIRWIAEASLGLDMKNAVVSFSHLAPVDEEMLREAEKLVLASTGSTLSLTLDDKRCSEIGVVVSSTDGKVSYNNLLSTRIRRYMKDIRKIIQEENAR